MSYFIILIPAYNESLRIGKTIASLRQDKEVKRILVVDDGSHDDTASRAEAAGAEVIRLLKNRGKGGAIMAAYPYLSEEFVLIIDADLQDTALGTLVLLKPVIEGQADMTIAKFLAPNSGRGFGLARKTASWGIRFLTGREFESPLSGQRCMRKELLQELFPLAPKFGVEVGMTIDALRKGYQIMEIDTNLKHSPPGRNWRGFLHRGRQFYHICSAINDRAWR